MKKLLLAAAFGAIALAPSAFATPAEDAIAAFRADPAVKARLGAPNDADQFDAILLSEGGELPWGTHTPIFSTVYLVVARQPAYTPHGFYQTNVFAQVYLSGGEVVTVRLVDLRAP